MASREYSKRLGVISDEQLQAALDRFGLGRLLSAEPAVGGLFGQNIMLATTGGAFVFRGDPHWDPEGNDDWQFQKERLFSQLVHESGTGPPVPWPYLLEESRDIFGWHWAIVPRLPGRAIFEPHRFSATEQRQQAAAMGAALAAVAQKLPDIPDGSTVLTFCYDTGERYFSVEGLFDSDGTTVQIAKHS